MVHDANWQNMLLQFIRGSLKKSIRLIIHGILLVLEQPFIRLALIAMDYGSLIRRDGNSKVSALKAVSVISILTNQSNDT